MERRQQGPFDHLGVLRDIKVRRSLWNRLQPGWRVSTLVWAFFGGALFIEHHDSWGVVLAIGSMSAALACAGIAAVAG